MTQMAQISWRPLVALVAIALLGAAMTLGGAPRAIAQHAVPVWQAVGAAPAATVDQAGTQAAQVSIGAHNYGYDAPDSVPSGTVTFTMQNDGPDYHMAQFLRLNDGVTPDQVVAAAQNGEAKDALTLGTPAGGINAIDAGDSQTVTFDMAPGSYVMICFVYNEHDYQPHVQKGMMHPFTVTTAASGGAAPTADLTVTAQEYQFSVPSITPGQHTIQFANRGSQPHEMALVKLSSDVTSDQAQNTDQQPSYYSDPAGGVAVVAPGQSGSASVDFTPGVWMFICYVPDAASGVPHASLGMAQVIFVQDTSSTSPAGANSSP